jgi:hypothetical protein
MTGCVIVSGALHLVSHEIRSEGALEMNEGGQADVVSYVGCETLAHVQDLVLKRDVPPKLPLMCCLLVSRKLVNWRHLDRRPSQVNRAPVTRSRVSETRSGLENTMTLMSTSMTCMAAWNKVREKGREVFL